jgi:UDP-N-acetylglucosamine--N-acetylmuramyl-(pentapeptide) pyrophosphoryl-undecaprenol N-acetylglucosamine transferase
MNNSIQRIIISGGGTGGHIFPAIAIAEELKSRLKNADILFIGAQGKMESKVVPEAGFKIESIFIAGLERKLSLNNLLLPWRILQGLAQTFFIFRRFKPSKVIGTGGYVSLPTLFWAYVMGIPFYIQEQNAYPGLVNRIMARFAQKIFVAYPKLDKYFPAGKISITGNPVRQNINQAHSAAHAKEYFGLEADKPVVLAIGGSQGARGINTAIRQHLDFFQEEHLQLLWQTGKQFTETLPHYTQIVALPFIQDMSLAYAAADVIISRAGAIALSELALIGKPVLLVPFPFATDDHQTKNAKAWTDIQAAYFCPDKDLAEQLPHLVLELFKNPDMGKNAKTLARPLATQSIVNEILHEK